MKTRIVYVERKPSHSVSIERVFRQVAKSLPHDEFEVVFQSAPYGNGVAAIIRNLFFFRAGRADIYHLSGDIHYMSLVLPAAKSVLTIHDLVFLHRRSGLRRFILKKLYLDWPLRRMRYLTVVSQTIKDEILRLSEISPDRIQVIENPLLDGFSRQGTDSFNAERPVILHIGTADNKNLPNLIEAIRGIPCTLRIVGALDATTLDSLNGLDFENVTGLDSAGMVEAYKTADIVSFCSTYEGFGLPIIEAQAVGKPVITSDLPPMNQVAGSGAVLVDPHNALSIRAGIERLISDAGFRSALIAAGSENVHRFKPSLAADRYAELYRRVLAESRKIG